MTQLGRLSSLVAVGGLLVVCPLLAGPSIGQATLPPDRYHQWLAAIDAHQPGDPGRIAVEVSTWTWQELDSVVAEAKRQARARAEIGAEQANRILLRGAALHADIGRLIPEDTARRSPNQKTAYRISDGRWTGVRYISLHWQLARSLLDSVTPAPAAHPDVREWYTQTGADLLRMRQSAAAVDHYGRARQLFPSDPAILFGSGVLHEMFASTGLQAAAESVAESNRTAAAISSARGELVRAERFFRDSLTHRPDHLEARLRHGRVLDQLGRHDEASQELRRAITDGASDRLLYLAQLFLGRAEESRGHEEAARAAFETASALYPKAQSPRLALSQIARRGGNRSGAQRELQAIAGLPDDERSREDPWWIYYDIP